MTAEESIARMLVFQHLRHGLAPSEDAVRYQAVKFHASAPVDPAQVLARAAAIETRIARSPLEDLLRGTALVNGHKLDMPRALGLLA